MKTKIRLVRNIYWQNGRKRTSYAIQTFRPHWGAEGDWRNFMTFGTFFFALRAFNKLKQNKDEKFTIIEEAEVVL